MPRRRHFLTVTIPLNGQKVILVGTTPTEQAALHHHLDCLHVLAYCRHALTAPGMDVALYARLVEQIDALIGHRPAPSGPPRPDTSTGPPKE